MARRILFVVTLSTISVALLRATQGSGDIAARLRAAA